MGPGTNVLVGRIVEIVRELVSDGWKGVGLADGKGAVRLGTPGPQVGVQAARKNKTKTKTEKRKRSAIGSQGDPSQRETLQGSLVDFYTQASTSGHIDGAVGVKYETFARDVLGIITVGSGDVAG